jgi:cyanophycinase
MLARLAALPQLALLLGSLVLSPGPASAADEKAAAPKGTLVIAGGALRADNAQVWQKIVDLAGGRGARIAVFPTAAGNPERSGRFLAETLERYGASAFVVPLAP